MVKVTEFAAGSRKVRWKTFLTINLLESTCVLTTGMNTLVRGANVQTVFASLISRDQL